MAYRWSHFIYISRTTLIFLATEKITMNLWAHGSSKVLRHWSCSILQSNFGLKEYLLSFCVLYCRILHLLAGLHEPNALWKTFTGRVSRGATRNTAGLLIRDCLMLQRGDLIPMSLLRAKWWDQACGWRNLEMWPTLQMRLVILAQLTCGRCFKFQAISCGRIKACSICFRIWGMYSYVCFYPWHVFEPILSKGNLPDW